MTTVDSIALDPATRPPSSLQVGGLPSAEALCQQPIHQALERLGSSERGLTDEEAALRRAAWGSNEPAPVERRVLLKQTVRRIASPLVALLLVASVVSAFLGDVTNTAIIFSIV